MLERYRNLLEQNKDLCILYALSLTILIGGFLFENRDKDIIFIDLLFEASEPALIIAILGIIAATEVTAYTILFLIVSVSSSVMVKLGREIYSSTSLSKSLTKIIIIPSTAKITIIALLLLLVALYSQEALPNIVWLIILGLLILFTIHEIWNSTNSVYYILIQCQPDHELYRELWKLKSQQHVRGVAVYELKSYHILHLMKIHYPKLYKKIYSDLNKNVNSLDSQSPQKVMNRLNERFISDVQKSIPDVDAYTLLSILQEKESKTYKPGTYFRDLIPKNPDPADITKICLDLMYQDSLIESSETRDFKQSREILEACLVLLYTHKVSLEKKYGKWYEISAKRLHYINPNLTHMYALCGDVLYTLGEYEGGKTLNAAAYYSEAVTAYEYANIADPKNTVALDNIQFIKNYRLNREVWVENR